MRHSSGIRCSTNCRAIAYCQRASVFHSVRRLLGSCPVRGGAKSLRICRINSMSLHKSPPAFPGSRFLIPTADAVDKKVREIAAGAKLEIEIALNAFDRLIPRCDLVLCKSGTSTLHVAAWTIPMIVVYRLNPILWHGFARWVIKSKKIALVNILAGNIDLVPGICPLARVESTGRGSRDRVAPKSCKAAGAAAKACVTGGYTRSARRFGECGGNRTRNGAKNLLISSLRPANRSSRRTTILMSDTDRRTRQSFDRRRQSVCDSATLSISF